MYQYKALVTRVVDGDTVDIDIDLGFKITTHQRVRLNGINAPETSTDEGKASRDFLRSILPLGAQVTVDSVKPGGGDKYGRYLASIDYRNENINSRMVNEGHAKAWDGQGSKP